MKVRDMPQLIIRVSPKSKQWIEVKAKNERRSQNYIVNWALEKMQELDNAKSSND